MDFSSLYRSKVVTAEQAVAHIKSGSRVYLGGGAGVPIEIMHALTRRAPELRNVEIVHILTFADAPYMAPELQASFRHNALFIGHNARTAVQEGRADFTPVFLSEIPDLFRSGGTLPLDAALVSLSPPDEHGFCSFGVEVGTTKPAAEEADIIIAEVNQQMPRTLGDSFIHISRLHSIVEVDYPLPLAPQGGSSELHLKVGQHIAGMIPDGATLQMGIGSIPDAVLQNLTNHKDLGIHTELFSDGVVEMVERGVITCRRKTFHPGKIIAGFLFGSQRLYDFVNNNPIIELHPTDYVNNPFNIAQNDKMVCINSAISVDLTGQVCADSIGTRLYSGVGGQLDFVRGAGRSKGGMPFIAFLSTAKNDTMSRIVPMLAPGSGVVTTRNDVHYVATEYGVAALRGKTIRERTQALIRIAHPKFREELTQQAKELGYL
ncbi:MAG TPA: acetyl-CoA hydrolase/transferase C-terminal domain-containing protein [Anaerolineae bacterium]|nr:acetyl-CoA hydrolase/transferase C-terminal domain-containing protein [Anaerolineae bacterium]